MQDDVVEHLADAEKLVVELKDIIRRMFISSRRTKLYWQEERKAADNKIRERKLYVKAKVTSLNRHLEEMKAQGGAASPTEPPSQVGNWIETWCPLSQEPYHRISSVV
ncbi:Golgin subfamily B member 1 [Lemmus lemmus]